MKNQSDCGIRYHALWKKKSMSYATTRLVESIKQEFNINLSKPYGALYVTQMNSVYRAPWLAGAKVINEQQEFNFRPFSRYLDKDKLIH